MTIKIKVFLKYIDLYNDLEYNTVNKFIGGIMNLLSSFLVLLSDFFETCCQQNKRFFIAAIY